METSYEVLLELWAREIEEAISLAADNLGWSKSYRTLAMASLGAAFRATELDEMTDKISVSPEGIDRVAERIIEFAHETGMAERTGRNYAGMWRRIGAIAARWAEMEFRTQGLMLEAVFDPLRDKRVFRRGRRLRHLDGSRRQLLDGVSSTVISVETEAGLVEIVVPQGFDRESAFQVITKLTSYIDNLRSPGE